MDGLYTHENVDIYGQPLNGFRDIFAGLFGYYICYDYYWLDYKILRKDS